MSLCRNTWWIVSTSPRLNALKTRPPLSAFNDAVCRCLAVAAPAMLLAPTAKNSLLARKYKGRSNGYNTRRIGVRKICTAAIDVQTTAPKTICVPRSARKSAASSASTQSASRTAPIFVPRVRNLAHGEPLRNILDNTYTNNPLLIRACPHFACPVPCGSVSGIFCSGIFSAPDQTDRFAFACLVTNGVRSCYHADIDARLVSLQQHLI